MEKDLQYLAYARGQLPIMRGYAERLNDNGADQSEREKKRRAFISLLIDSAIQEGEKDLEELPKLHAIAAARDSWKAFYIYCRLEQGRTYAQITREINAFCKFARAKDITPKHYYTVRERSDSARKKINAVIRAYTGEQDTARELMTDKRLKQYPYLKALKKLIDEGAQLEELQQRRDKIEAELKALEMFFAEMESANTYYDFAFIKLRYLQGEKWEDVGTAQGISADTARKITERLIEKYNRQKKA